ncbi:MAG TPA: hypothetical protein V6C89_01980 [Drouetiella sp.]
MEDSRYLRVIAMLRAAMKNAAHPQSRRFVAMLAICSLCWFSGRASAYNASILNSLARSRDALLTQRAHLQDAADETQRKINEYQSKLDSINSYLTDTDNALRDVESAMARAN